MSLVLKLNLFDETPGFYQEVELVGRNGAVAVQRFRPSFSDSGWRAMPHTARLGDLFRRTEDPAAVGRTLDMLRQHASALGFGAPMFAELARQLARNTKMVGTGLAQLLERFTDAELAMCDGHATTLQLISGQPRFADADRWSADACARVSGWLAERGLASQLVEQSPVRTAALKKAFARTVWLLTLEVQPV